MKRSTLRVIALVLLLTVAGVGIYAYRIIRRGFSAREEPGMMEAALATSARSMAIPARYKGMKNPVTATPEVFREGMEHWADHCATCHANNGSGDTMYGKTMYPRPPDMRQARTQNLSDGELYSVIKNGVRLTGMPAFGDPGDDDIDSWKLVVFIRHLPTLSDREQMEMEKLNPKSPKEMQEEMEEEQFLNGGKSSMPAMTPHTHH
jgi:mono/diheme cytochrome c family protein